MDRLLDQPVCGPVFLQQPDIAGMVVDALHHGQDRFRRYDLHAFVVMSNHVHVLVTPHVDGKKWLGPLKGFTAHEANRILGRSGRFWQDESYDRLVRDDTEFQRVLRYIENNPVSAGICASPEEFLWSSATPDRSPAEQAESLAPRYIDRKALRRLRALP